MCVSELKSRDYFTQWAELSLSEQSAGDWMKENFCELLRSWTIKHFPCFTYTLSQYAAYYMHLISDVIPKYTKYKVSSNSNHALRYSSRCIAIHSMTVNVNRKWTRFLCCNPEKLYWYFGKVSALMVMMRRIPFSIYTQSLSHTFLSNFGNKRLFRSAWMNLKMHRYFAHHATCTIYRIPSISWECPDSNHFAPWRAYTLTLTEYLFNFNRTLWW